jgi:thiamine biosynthesis lipoprotein
MHMLSGPTMGTTYTVRWLATADTPSEYELRTRIDAELARVDAQMSRYRSDSELSRINAAVSTEPQAVSRELADMLATALQVQAASKGALDPTIGALVDAWGFGPRTRARVPDAAELRALLERRGSDLLEVTLTPPSVRKRRADIVIDVNAVAPGQAADRIAALLRAAGVENLLVEIGGEIRVEGHNAAGRPWRIAIDDPRHEEPIPYAFVELSTGAIATSGGYRHYRIVDGQRYSHLLDPRSGRPVVSATAAVVVIAPTALLADAWATALFVLGAQDGLEVARQHDVAALFLIYEGDALQELTSPAFGRYRLSRLPAA